MAKNIEDNEKRFVFVRGQILSFEECMEEGPKKCQSMKLLVTWALKEFSAIDMYKCDPRMLDLWKLMGKYSVNIGMDGVLENVHRLGFFKSTPEFYLMWADYLGSKENREHFDQVVEICEENCQISASKCQELFRPLLQKYFDTDYSEGKTLDFIRLLADKDDVVRPDLTLFQRKKGAPSTSTAPPPTFIITNSVTAAKIDKPFIAPQTINTSSLDPPQKNKQVRLEEFSVFKDVTTTKVAAPAIRRVSYYPDLDDVTIAGSDGRFSSDMFTSTPRRSIMPNAFEPLMEDFTEGNQFFDPPEKEEKREEVGLFGCQISDKTIIKGIGGEGGGGKLKNRLSFADENQRGKEGSKNSNPMAEAVERMKKAKNNPNELIRTLPQLKISSPINEDSEDMKTFDSPEFPSPFRKKKKGE
uniref:BUB1 N-terminal domain-containing protein n=1 Tax=Meloidogyne hapla TaxID=6305 RepID=A0A1I8C386_MELHA